MAAKVDAKLKKVFDTHLPTDEASSRAVQRVAALYIGHTAGKIEPQALRELCDVLGLFSYEGKGKSKENHFGANFTQNMKKDASLFDGDHSAGWKLTAAGKAEAKSIFDEGHAPTKRRVEGGKPKTAKPKAVKPPKKPATPTKKASTPKGGKKPTKAPKPASKKPATGGQSEEERKKAAKRRLAKKRDLSPAPTGAEAPNAPAAASAPDSGPLPT